MNDTLNETTIKKLVIDVIEKILEQKNESDKFDNINEEQSFNNDLGFDSLDLAQLSAMLEESFGKDPYSAGKIPLSVEEVVSFYISE